MLRLKTVLIIITCGILVWNSSCNATPYRALLSQRPDVEEFIDTMVLKHNFKKDELNTLFNQVELRPHSIKSIKSPYEKETWAKYKKLFITEQRINLGAKFWQIHAAALERASKKYGVPPEIIVAILGVETKYGRNQGTYRVIDALATLAFNYPERSKFFKKELVQFLLLSRELETDPLSILGSYAGAIGQAQFMPSSYRYYAVDFAGDGKRDLRNNSVDAIGSIANYLEKNGWKANEAIVVKARVTGDKFDKFVRKSSKPKFKISKLIKNEIEPITNLDKKTLASAIKLQAESAPEYWLGLQNFYVITRYNTSKLYAMAVFQLGNEIKARYNNYLEKQKT